MLDQPTPKERIESRSQPLFDNISNAVGWISLPQRKELKADHNQRKHVMIAAEVGSAYPKGKN